MREASKLKPSFERELRIDTPDVADVGLGAQFLDARRGDGKEDGNERSSETAVGDGAVLVAIVEGGLGADFDGVGVVGLQRPDAADHMLAGFELAVDLLREKGRAGGHRTVRTAPAAAR